MYQGEVNVAKEDLPSFLEVVEDLLIRGLSERKKEGKNSNHEEPPKSYHQNEAVSPKRKRIVSTEEIMNPPITVSIGQISEPLQKVVGFIDTANFSGAFQSYLEIKSKEVKEENNEQSSILVTQGEQFICEKCDKQFSTKQALKIHIESIHQKISVTCDKCDKQFSSNRALRQHNSTVHEGVRYPCKSCDYKATTNANLHRHEKLAHQ